MVVVDKKVVDGLSEPLQDKLCGMKKFHLLRLIRRMTSMFNGCCTSCKQLMVQDNCRPLKDYCKTCQELLLPVLEKFMKKVNKK